MSRLRVRLKGCMDPGSRSAQQDDWGASDEALYDAHGLLAVLSDGMGGMEAGDRFSKLAVAEMLRAFEESPEEPDPCLALLKAYAAAREEALKLCRSENLDGGATVVAVLLREDRMAFLSVGDSRMYLLRGGGLIQLNREQTLGVTLDEGAALGFVFREEAERNVHRASMTNHLCQAEDRPCDRNLQPLVLVPGDRIALVSDGVSGTLSDQELELLLNEPGISGAEAVIRAVKEKNKPRQDNMSILLLAVEEKTAENLQEREEAK